MLPAKRRIPRELLGSLLQSRSFKNSEHFSLRSSPAQGDARFSVSVSKKVSKKATIRNRTRRRVYSAIRHLSVVNSGLYLLSAKSGAEKIKGEDLKNELRKLL